MQVVLTVGKTQLGKKNLWLDWEKTVYRSLFALANTLEENFIPWIFIIAIVLCCYPWYGFPKSVLWKLEKKHHYIYIPLYMPKNTPNIRKWERAKCSVSLTQLGAQKVRLQHCCWQIYFLFTFTRSLFSIKMTLLQLCVNQNVMFDWLPNEIFTIQNSTVWYIYIYKVRQW